MNASRNPFVRFPGWLFAVFLLGFIQLIWQSTQVSIDTDPLTLLESDQRHRETFDRIQSFLNNDTVVVVSVESDQIFSQAGFDHIRAISNALGQQPGFVDVKSLTHSYKPVRRGFSLAMEPFVPAGTLSEEQIAGIRQFSVTHPLVRNIMVSPDGKITLITATYKRDLSTQALRQAFRDKTIELLAQYNSSDYRTRTISLPFIAEEISESFYRDLKLVLPGTALLILLVIGLTLRSFPCLVLLLISELALVAMLPGVLGLAGFSLSPYNLLLLPLLGAINLTMLTHQLTALRKSDAALSMDERFAAMLHVVFRPSLFAAITTAIGMGSLSVSGVSQVRDFGVSGIIGIAIIFAWNFGPGLSFLRLSCRAWPSAIRLGSKELRSSNDRPLFRRLGQAAMARRWPAVAVITTLLLPALYAASHLNLDIRAIRFLSTDSPTRQMAEMMDARMGGINIVQLDFDTGRPNGINQLGFLRGMDSVQEFAEETGGFSSTYSYASLMAMMNGIWEGDESGALSLPTNPLTLNLFVLALKATNYPFLQALCDESQQTAHLVLRTIDLPSGEFVRLLESVEQFAKKNAPEGVAVSAEAGLHTILQADREIVDAQLSSLAITLISMLVVMAMLWRSARLAALALGVSLVPLAVLAMLAAGFAVPLNSVTAMIAALVLGISIDDAVHLVTHWLQLRKQGVEPAAALAESLDAKGPAILCTSLILTGFSAALAWVSFPPVQHFGWLSAAAYLAALMAVLWALPAFLATRR
ncbi:MAG: MMPL family transporter [Verrucomicrobiota bacterium]|nr:MMPL family transporter [Verrucomicrobiota bacterium]